jgi:hypothetical protein
LKEKQLSAPVKRGSFMNRNRNISIVRESSHDAKYVSSHHSAGGNSRGMSFAEFIERLEEHPVNQAPEKKSLKDLARTVIGIVSFGIFKNIIG